MGEREQGIDTTGMDEELARSRQLIDEAKASAEELAKTNPDPFETDAEDDEPSGFESRQDGPGGAVRASSGS